MKGNFISPKSPASLNGILIINNAFASERWRKSPFPGFFNQIFCLGIIFLFFFQGSAKAQLTCNVPERMNPPAHTSMTVSSSGGSAITYALLGGVLNEGNAISSSTSDFARMGQVLASLGIKYISIKDNSTSYPAGTFAGFEIATSTVLSLGLLSDISIRTYLAGVPQETVSGSSLVLSAGLLSASSRGTIGFTTTASFDEVRYISNGVTLLASETFIYNAVFETFCAGPALSCNTPTTLTSPTYPVTVDIAQTGLGGVVCGLCSITNTDNLTDASTSNFATIALTAAVGVSGSVAVVDNVTTYPAGTFAGFDIAGTSLLNVGLLSALSFETYNNGVATGDVATGASLVASNSSILSGSSRKTIGFITTQAFDEVKITATNLVGVSIGNLDIYGMVLENFCTAPLPACNTITPIVNPAYPVYVDGQHSGVDGIACLLCSINNSQNVIDNDLSNFASIVLPVGVATSAQFAVANALDTYPSNSYAGFDLETNSILSAAVISNATVSLYNNGSLVQTGSGNALIVGASTSLLVGTSRQIVGLIATVAYDEVKISFNQLVGADLGTIKIYSAVLSKSCSPVVLCNSTYYLNNPGFPVVINSQRTGLSGVATVAASVEDPWNVITASTTDYSRITNTAAVAAAASISVVDALTTYPAGTFAGFVINTPSAPLILLDLFNAITITTYNNNVLQEFKSGVDLVDLTVLATLIGTPAGSTYKAGFQTTLPFDEIRISVTNLVGVGLLGNYVDVYGAFVDTRSSATSTSITCQKTMPDINATFISVPATGSVHTNDVVPSGTTYGTAVALPGNPAATLPVINSDGTYTFTPTVAGVYQFNVPVCTPDAILPCPNELLTITVLNKSYGYSNPPVAHTDAAITQYNTPVTINALVNDAIGTPGTMLDTSSINVIDLNGASAGNTVKGGTAVANPTTGKITYTPPTGFVGIDTLQYQICDNQMPVQCAQAYEMITVMAPGAANATGAADDYQTTNRAVPSSGNVLNNDQDPEANTQTITPKSVTVPGQYSFVLNNDGSYTFTPSATFTGPADITYEVCDDGVPVACANATLHMLVAPDYPQSRPDFNTTFIGVPVAGNVHTNDAVFAGSTYGSPVADGGNPSATLPLVASDGSYTFTPPTNGVYKFMIEVCAPAATPPCPTELLTITVLNSSVGSKNPPVANTDIAATKYNTPVSIIALVNDGRGTPGSNLDTGSMTIADLNGATPGNTVKGGTAVVNTTTGLITYTPAMGFFGIDTVQYNVCDDQAPPMCADAFQVITVLAPSVANTTSASDDYKATNQGTATNGDVKTNDIDPEGNTQTVTAKTVSIPGSYAFVLNNDGTYTFTPDASFTGPADINYEICDNGSPSSCAEATLHMLVSPAAFPLPVYVTSFFVSMKDCASQISWTSGSEKLVQQYAVEYSSNGSNWSSIAQVNPKGNNSTYSNTHLPAKGDGYYRLKITEQTGVAVYTSAQKVTNFCTQTSLIVYPNPVQQNLYVAVQGAGTESAFELADAFGRRLLQGNLKDNTKNNLDLSGLGNGSYVLKVMSGGQTEYFKVQVLH